MSFAVIFHDGDVHPGKSFDDVTHWIAWNIPATSTGLPASVAAGDLPDGTPKTLWKLAIPISGRATFNLIGLMPRAGFVSYDQLSECESVIPGHATLLVSSLQSRRERHFTAVLHRPLLAATKPSSP